MELTALFRAEQVELNADEEILLQQILRESFDIAQPDFDA